jgi:hypothetical protein
MRETLWFVASLAGTVAMTALAVIVSPRSPFWRDVLVGGAYVLLVCAVLIFFDMRQPLRERPRMIPLIGMVICGLGFWGCVGWYFWPPSGDQREAAPLQMKETFQWGGAQKQVSLLWECQTATLPNVVPSGGVNTIETTIDDDGTNPNVDFVFSNAPPGSPYRKGHLLVQKCSLINFADETIFDIPIVFNVSFTGVSDERTGIKNVVAKGRSPSVPVRSLDRGRDNSYVIYILNLSRKFAVDIELPTTASYVTVSDSTRKEAKFLPLGMNELFMTLFPAIH